MTAAQYSLIARKAPAMLAAFASTTAVSLSVLAGWQRGGWIAERALWIAIGVALVLAAHLLPALCRRQPWPLLVLGALLWTASMAATCYGHAVFFTLAQRHAAEARAALAVQAPPLSPSQTATVARPLAEITRDRAATIARLAEARSRRCTASCAALEARRTALAARLDALDTEATEGRREEVAQDRAEAVRDTARADPVTAPLAALIGVPAARLDLISGLAFAAVLEGVACFCWLLAFAPKASAGAVTAASISASNASVTAPLALVVPPVTATPDGATVASNEPIREAATPPATPVTSAGNPVMEPVATAADGGAREPDDDLDRISRGVAAGELRGTVAGIRRYLGCGQTRAVELRRQLNT